MLNPILGISSNSFKLYVQLLPPWYYSLPAKVLYFIFSLILISLIIFLITKRYKSIYQKKFIETQLELAAVRNILKPHFVHNTLNTLQSLIYYKDFENVNDYIVKLSKWFRSSLKDNQEQIVLVSKELELIMAYINLEKIKLPKTFKTLILDKTKVSSALKVPFFILQPVVENVFKYSLISKDDPRLSIIISEYDKYLEILVMDNGSGEKGVNSNSTNSGINLIKKKLELCDKLSKTKHNSSYQISYNKGVGAISKIKIYDPIRE